MIRTVLSPVITALSLFFRQFGGRCCRFHPSCSAYAHEALDKLPAHRALYRITMRILHCHPFSAGGYDPVPGR